MLSWLHRREKRRFRRQRQALPPRRLQTWRPRVESLEPRMLLSGSAPTDLSISANFVDENQPVGTVIGQFSATDPDEGDTFTYSFVDGEGDADNDLFTIDGDTLSTASSFDHETSKTRSIRVCVTDQDGGTFERQFTVFIQNVNEGPTSLALSKSKVDENQAAGTVVGTFSAKDPEGDTSLTYSLVSGDGDTDNASFTISGAQLKTKAKFDFETKASYSILVRVTDSSKVYSDQAFTISVNDVNEAPTARSFAYSVLQKEQLSVPAPGLLEDAADPEGVAVTPALVSGSGPKGGTLSINTDGSFVYQPSGTFVGTDQFQYRTFDGKNYSPAATVTITVEYDADPVVEPSDLVVGGNNLVLARVGDNLRLVNFTSRKVLIDRDVSELNSITVLGVDNRADTLTIDASAGGVLPGGVVFHGGGGAKADTVVLRGSAGTDVLAVAEGSVAINGLGIAVSGVEQLLLEGGAGDDVYQIAALPVAVTISDTKGTDTLDFSAASTGATINLGSKTGQTVFAGGAKLTLKGTLENVVGTDSADWIKGNSAANLLAGLGGADTIYGGSGNDVLDGGDGDDLLFGDSGNDVLLGGAGNDRLEGGSGRDLLLGGAGLDTLRGGSGDDLLVGGTTLYDTDPAALAAIFSEWTSRRSFAKRIANLTAGIQDSLGRTIRLERGSSVLDDGARDDLYGNSGCDWFFDFPSDTVHDRGRSDR